MKRTTTALKEEAISKFYLGAARFLSITGPSSYLNVPEFTGPITEITTLFEEAMLMVDLANQKKEVPS